MTFINPFSLVNLVIGNKINIILIIQILPLVYAPLAKAMAHLVPEMGQDGPSSLVYLHLCQNQRRLPLVYDT